MKKRVGFFILLLMISSCEGERDQEGASCDYDFGGTYLCKLYTLTEVPDGALEQLSDVELEISQTIDNCSIIFWVDSSLQIEAQVNDSGIFTSFKPEWVNSGDYSTSGKFFGTDSVQIIFRYYHEVSVHDYYYILKHWLGNRK